MERSPFNASTPLAALAEDVTPTSLHYVRNHFPVPSADAKAWRVEVEGHVERPRGFTVRDLERRHAAREVTVTLECAGNGRSRMRPSPPGTPWDEGAVSTASFTGVSLRDVLGRCGLRSGAVEVLLVGADRGPAGGREIAFERSVPLADALLPDTILAWAMNGERLLPDHGFPVRAVVPGWYGVASVKWLSRVEVLTEPFDGFFQRERYTFDGWQPEEEPPVPVQRMRVKSLIHAPASGARVRVGVPVRVVGRAWSGAARVVRVDVSADGGASWVEAGLAPPVAEHAWRAFAAEWTPRERGPATLLARASDASGASQPLELPANRHGYGNNAVLPVRVTVE